MAGEGLGAALLADGEWRVCQGLTAGCLYPSGKVNTHEWAEASAGTWGLELRKEAQRPALWSGTV